jgi:hypothetical protein
VQCGALAPLWLITKFVVSGEQKYQSGDKSPHSKLALIYRKPIDQPFQRLQITQIQNFNG